MCDDRSVHLHGSKKELSCAQSSGRLLRLLLCPGLDQLPHDSHRRPDVPGAQEAQIDLMGLRHRPANIQRYKQEHLDTFAYKHTLCLNKHAPSLSLTLRLYKTLGDKEIHVHHKSTFISSLRFGTRQFTHKAHIFVHLTHSKRKPNNHTAFSFLVVYCSHWMCSQRCTRTRAGVCSFDELCYTLFVVDQNASETLLTVDWIVFVFMHDSR